MTTIELQSLDDQIRALLRELDAWALKEALLILKAMME